MRIPTPRMRYTHTRRNNNVNGRKQCLGHSLYTRRLLDKYARNCCPLKRKNLNDLDWATFGSSQWITWKPDRFFPATCPPPTLAHSCISIATFVFSGFRGIDRSIIMKPVALFLSLFVFFGLVAAWSKEGGYLFTQTRNPILMTFGKQIMRSLVYETM